MLKISTGLRNAMLATGSFRTAVASCVLNIYAGTEPATADAALGGATLLCTITTDGDGTTALAWEASAAAGVLTKELDDTWSGTNLETGTASFFRMQTLADPGDSSDSAVRIQGNCALAGGDLNLSSLALVEDAVLTLDYGAVSLPAA